MLLNKIGPGARLAGSASRILIVFCAYQGNKQNSETAWQMEALLPDRSTDNVQTTWSEIAPQNRIAVASGHLVSTVTATIYFLRTFKFQ
jgi:hypothetical protein